ncbi:MAG: radical SAM protein, partial [Clostridiales bacterium]|nr:radical SAM protein [Clostridiales bacterium]
ECEPFGRCVHSCPNGCLSIAGETVSSDDLAERLRENKDFLTMTGGGITISGGEPLIQHEFIVSLCRELKGIHLALQTGGYASKEVYKDVVGRFDYIMQDIKLADEEEHIKYTGVSNIPILENIEYLMKSGKEYVFRVPLIPGITDTDNNLKSIARIVGNSKVELLPYNTLAGAKYAMLGMNYTLENEGNRDIDYTAFFLNAVIR